MLLEVIFGDEIFDPIIQPATSMPTAFSVRLFLENSICEFDGSYPEERERTLLQHSC